MLSRKHYKMIAKCIKDCLSHNICHSEIGSKEYPCPCIDKNSLIDSLSDVFQNDNRLFCSDTFKDACND